MSLNSIADATGQKPRPSGRPAGTLNSAARRNHRRINNFNTQRAGNSWADLAAVEEAAKEVDLLALEKEHKRSGFERRRARRPSGKPERNVVDSEQQKGVKTTPPKNDLMWDDGPYGGTSVVQQQYSQNLEYSTFVDVCKATYLELEHTEARLRRRMPFCLFQHSMTQVLNTYLIDSAKTENADPEFYNETSPTSLLPQDMQMPEMVSDYISSIGQTVTPTGDRVYVNLPESGRPEAPNDDGQNGGFFGVCDAATHNKYETYVSPGVTKALIDRTVIVNRNPNQAGAFETWNPLPAEYTPPNAVATPNLLGYALPERLQPEGISKCENLHFANGPNMAGRLLDCPQVNMLVSDVLQDMSRRVKMTAVFPKPKVTNSVLGITVVSDQSPSTESLSAQACHIESPIALGVGSTNKAGTFGLKRRRTHAARGHCYVAIGGAALHGWNDTINANLEMNGSFRPLIGIHKPSLLERLHHTASPGGLRLIRLYDFAKKYRID